jgi:hypothetical protein
VNGVTTIDELYRCRVVWVVGENRTRAYRRRFPTTLVCRSGSGSETLTDDAPSAGPRLRGCKTGASGSIGNGPPSRLLLYCVPP